MKKLDLEMLKELLMMNDFPILVEELPNELLEDAIILMNDIDISLLNGHYEQTEFLPPVWYYKLVEKAKEKQILLILNRVNFLPKEEQLKFLEILKYRKISTFPLPKNCSIIVVVPDLENHPLAQEIYNIVAKV